MPPDSDAVNIRNLSFAWRPQEPALLKLPELRIHKGEALFVKGSSGSGKTTLLSLIGGVLSPQQGDITVIGQRLNELSGAQRDAFRAEHIGFVFQMFNLIPYLSVVENVLLPCRFSKRRRDKIESAGETLTTEAMRLLNHLDLSAEVLRRPVTELSVGQQQRVAAARALAGSPELIIADEPTSALDSDRRSAFLQLLLDACAEQHSTLIFVSHDSALESQFDRSLSLSDINQA